MSEIREAPSSPAPYDQYFSFLRVVLIVYLAFACGCCLACR